ncbi:hypothetical protein ATK74_0586 [Propionicimonas paludicola]|uniref:Uncharacterized protein n=1 Tax=Propionicimonas paludicola TaxID=185243 RepID=A0A2A9CNM3_9ACTN|nr:hypothetical protein [Propionicimonas paludicola]PFG16057.1 hypothetical protein ATK74_0586 [Propionicimonas paludicola]
MRNSVLAGIAATLILFTGCTSAAAPSNSSSPAASQPAPAASATSAAPTSAAPSASATAESDLTRAAACLEIGKTANEAATTLNTALKDIGSDPKKSLSALKEFSKTMNASIAKLEDPAVKAQSEKAVAAVEEVSAALEKLIKNPTADALNKLSEPLAKVDAEFTAIGTVCGG